MTTKSGMDLVEDVKGQFENITSDVVQPETQACVSYFDVLRAQGQVFDLAVNVHAGGTFRNHLLFSMGPRPSEPPPHKLR
ncbi:MAG: hypothetical protein ABI210_10275 [Abditibacteriaceae bacterium]